MSTYYYSRYWGVFAISNPENWAAFPNSTDFRGFGYSGRASQLNNVHAENQKDIGPLPRARYVVTKIYNDPERGNNTCELTPDVNAKMYGRSGFLIHGDTDHEAHDASNGCIATRLWVREQFQVGDEIYVL